tara:strand:- start:1022 stop:1585 length:564 start_codon:yes stop_codon:yes gene_type:complete
MKIKTMEPIIIDSAFIGPSHTEAEYEAQNLHWLYLWKLEGLNLPTEHEPIKLGIAKQIYKTKNFEAGWSARIRGCLRDMQKSFGRDDLTAKVIGLKLADMDTIYDAERYVHFAARHNFANKVNQVLSGDTLKTWRSVGGQSEFYDASESSMLGRFYNSLRKTNRLLGAGIIAKMLEEAHIARRQNEK